MINKKNVLGKAPEAVGDKDAIHVAIVSVRAAGFIEPGKQVKLNEFNEAEQCQKGVGAADPFRKSITTGDIFWLLLNQDQVPNVQHVWEHPKVKDWIPTRHVKLNHCLSETAKDLGVTYEQLMAACAHIVEHDTPLPYPKPINSEDLDTLMDEKFERYDVWSEWASETGYEFDNNGSECCPEYDYPRGPLFCLSEEAPE